MLKYNHSFHIYSLGAELYPLNSVYLSSCIAGNSIISWQVSGIRKANSLVSGSIDWITSKTGSPVGFLVPMRFTWGVITRLNLRNLTQLHPLTDLPPSITIFRCDNCDYRAARKSYLNTHMLRHHGSTEFYSDQCVLKSWTSVRWSPTFWSNSEMKYTLSCHSQTDFTYMGLQFGYKII